MNIKKMLLLAGMVLALVAFAAPSVAQADVTLTDPDGTPLKAGDIFTATSTNLKTTTENGAGPLLSCAHVELHLEVVTNGLNHVKIKQLGEATTQNCHLLTPATLPVTITDGTLGAGLGENNELTINTWGTGETNATFVSKIYSGAPHGTPTLLATCHFHGPVHVEATHSARDRLAITGSKLTGTGAGCAKEGTLHGEFKMDTANGDPVTLDFVATT